MTLKPAEAADIQNLLLSITNLAALEEYSHLELEPSFDPLIGRLWEALDWKTMPSEIEELDLLSAEWREFISKKINNSKPSKFVNFYIYYIIQQLQQSCKESVDDIDLLKEEFAFYDLLSGYENLDKRNKKLIDEDQDVEQTRQMFYSEIYG
jgi:hypothetical protein